jgi:hypothetical protein
MDSKYINEKLPINVLKKIYCYLTLHNIKCNICSDIIDIKDFYIRTTENKVNCLDCFNKKQLINQRYKNIEKKNILNKILSIFNKKIGL